MTARDKLRSPVVQARFGPAAAGATLSYQVPESVALAQFVSLRTDVVTAVGSTPSGNLIQISKQGDVKFESPQESPLVAATTNTVSWGPAGTSATGEGGTSVQQTIPGLTIEAGDVFRLSLSGGGGADVIGPATLVYEVMDLSFDAA